MHRLAKKSYFELFPQSSARKKHASSCQKILLRAFACIPYWLLCRSKTNTSPGDGDKTTSKRIYTRKKIHALQVINKYCKSTTAATIFQLDGTGQRQQFLTTLWYNELSVGTGQRWERLRKSKKHQNLVYWFNSILTEHGDALDEVTAAYVGKRGLGKVPAVKAIVGSGKSNTAVFRFYKFIIISVGKRGLGKVNNWDAADPLYRFVVCSTAAFYRSKLPVAFVVALLKYWEKIQQLRQL